MVKGGKENTVLWAFGLLALVAVVVLVGLKMTGFILETSSGVMANSPPAISSLVLNSSFDNNTIFENLTAYPIGVNDADGDSVKTIYNWYRNNATIEVLNMPFENNTGNVSKYALDYSGLKNNGTVIDGLVWNSTGGHDGKGVYKFDGTAKYIDIANRASLDPTSVSVVAWYKPAATPVDYYFIAGKRAFIGSGNWNGYQLYHYLDGKAYFWTASGSPGTSLASKTVLQANRWYFIVASYSNGVLKIYINGTLENTVAGTAKSASAGPFSIGRDPYTTPRLYPNGYIDDVIVFNRDLSDEEVKALYDRTDRIVYNEINLGEKWGVCATPNDGVSDGTTVCSNNLTISSRVGPTIQQVVLNSSSGTDTASENITAYAINVSSGAGGNPVKFIYNWYKNNISLAVLNMPFEVGINKTFAEDYSQYGNNGAVTTTLLNPAIWSQTGGYDGRGAYLFDGTAKYVNIANTASLDPLSVTVTAWYKPARTPSDYSIIAGKRQWLGCVGCWGGYQLYNYVDGKVIFWTSAGDNGKITTSKTVLQNNQWYFIAGSYSNNTLKIYVNGVLENTTTASVKSATAGTLSIGRDSYTGGIRYFVNGTVDEVQTYNGTLSAAQIDALYHNRTDMIVSDELKLGDTWKVCVTPNDGLSDGSQVCSNDLTVTTADTTSPNVNIIYPVNNTTYNYSQKQLNYAASDNVNLKQCWYSLDLGLSNYTIACGQNVTGISSHEGNNSWTVWASDAAGNINYSRVVFTINTPFPLIAIDSPTNTTYNSTVILVAIYSSGAESIWFTNSTGQNETYSGEVNKTFSEGSNTLIAYVNNSAGTMNSTSVTFSVNTGAPSIFIISPVNIIYNTATVLVNISAIGAQSKWFSSGGITETYTGEVYKAFSDGNYTLTAYADNGAGNVNQTNTTFVVDSVTPSVTITSPANTTYNNATISVAISATEADYVWFTDPSGQNETYSGEVNKTFSEGSNILYAYANRSNQNVGSDVKYFIVDTIDPRVTIASPTAAIYNSSTASVDVRLNEGGYCEYDIDLSGINKLLTANGSNTGFTGTTSSLSNGNHTLNAYCNDFAINTNYTESVNFSIASTGSLTAALVLPAQNITVNPGSYFVVTSNISCSGGTCGNVSAYLDPRLVTNVAESKTNSSLIILLIGLGCIVIFLILVNYIPDNKRMILAILLGIVFVGIFFASLRMTGYVAGGVVPMNTGNPFYTNNSNPSNCGVLASGDSCNNSWTVYTNGSAAAYEFYVIYNSTTAGVSQASTSSVYVTINAPPQVTIISPINTTYTSATTSVNIGLNEAGYCEYSLSSGVTNLTLTANSTSTGFSGTTSSLSNGNYTLNAYCNDSSGNTNYTESVPLTISVTAAPPPSGGGGGAAGCVANYSCGDWSVCSDGKQTRVCNDTKCGNIARTEEMSCGGSSCVPLYDNCSEWSACIDNIQNRTCGDTTCKFKAKDFSQNCTVEQPLPEAAKPGIKSSTIAFILSALIAALTIGIILWRRFRKSGRRAKR